MKPKYIHESHCQNGGGQNISKAPDTSNPINLLTDICKDCGWEMVVKIDGYTWPWKQSPNELT